MKKLLVIGSYYTELEIVRRAKKLGYYTIVTDNHHDSSQVPAKREADEAWDVSWTDIDKLTSLCRAHNVSGVLGGFSEFRVESMIRLCNKLGFSCSLTLEQLAVTRNKLSFKQLCKRYSIPCVREFTIDDNDITFPVIVKPVDLAGSIGISVVYNKNELLSAYDNAKSLSESGDVIVEEYISEGTKVDVYYYVKKGEIRLLGTSDTIMCKGTYGSKVLQNAWPFPSHHETQYLKDVDSVVQAMIRGIGIDNCYLTISFFWRNGEFYCFEAGFRLSGEMSFNYYSAISGYDYLDDMIRFSLGDEGTPLPVEQPKNLKCVILNFYSLDGIIGMITGIKEINQLPEVFDFLPYCEKGESIENKTRVLKKIGMCTLVAESSDSLCKSVDAVNASFKVLSQEGKDLIYERLSSRQLELYYQDCCNA